MVNSEMIITAAQRTKSPSLEIMCTFCGARRESWCVSRETGKRASEIHASRKSIYVRLKQMEALAHKNAGRHSQTKPRPREQKPQVGKLVSKQHRGAASDE